MDFKLSVLENDLVQLFPLVESDFDALYQVASDPMIWEQHPQKNRYEESVFRLFFDEAITHQLAYKIIDKNSGELIGSSRYYNCDFSQKSIAIGYTFIARKFWGTPYNASIKSLMIQFAFTHFDLIYFHVDQNNFRSQRAVEKLGAIKLGTKPRELNNQIPGTNFEYLIKKELF